MRFRSNLTLLLFAAFASSALLAQVVQIDWSQVLARPNDHVLVQARVVTLEGKLCLQFQNGGQDSIHFHYGVNGSDPLVGPRIHLSTQKRSAYLPLPQGTTVSSVKLILVRTGPDRSHPLPD